MKYTISLPYSFKSSKFDIPFTFSDFTHLSSVNSITVTSAGKMRYPYSFPILMLFTEQVGFSDNALKLHYGGAQF
jgi:hypothetical protein